MFDTTDASFAHAGAAVFEELRASAFTAEQRRLSRNPFLAGLEVETRRRATGEVLDSETLYDANAQAVETRHTLIRHVDRAEFVKVLSRSYHLLFDLGKAGQRMFWYLAEAAQRSPNTHEIYLHWREVVEFRGEVRTGEGRGTSRISKSAFYDGVRQLEAAGFLARQERVHWFWLNPRRVWNGNRVTFIETIDSRSVAHLPENERPKVVKPSPEGTRKPRTRAKGRGR